MNEVTVFAMAYMGGLTGVLTAVVPAIWLIKKKLKNYNPMQNNPMQNIFRGLNNESSDT